KIYNILSLGIPFLYIGPEASHITDIIRGSSYGESAFFARHGEVERVISQIVCTAKAPVPAAVRHLQTALRFSHAILVPRLIEVITRKPRQAGSQTQDRKHHAAAMGSPNS